MTKPNNPLLEWELKQDSDLQRELDRVTDSAIQKVIDRRITPEKDKPGVGAAERAKLVLARASMADQGSIESFFKAQPINLSGLELIQDRSPDFFSLLRARGHASASLTARLGASRELWGLGSISVREGFFNRAPARVAYLGDLRMLLSRSTARVWRQLYSQILQDVADELKVAGFLTAIVGDNKAALRSLVSRRNSEFVYEPLGRMRLLGILGRKGWLANGRRKLEAERLSVGVEAEAEFRRFSSLRAREIRHGWVETPTTGVPIVLRNRHGETKIVARLVSPNPMKRLRVQSVDWRAQAVFQAMCLTGAPAVSAGSGLPTTYLSWVCYGAELTPVEKRHALIELIDVCLQNEAVANELSTLGLVSQMLLVPDTIGLSLRELGGRLHYSTPVELFEVRPGSDGASANPAPDLRGQVLQDIGFEMSLL